VKVFRLEFWKSGFYPKAILQLKKNRADNFASYSSVSPSNDLERLHTYKPLFDADLYRANAVTHGLTVPEDHDAAFDHWLLEGFPIGIVASKMFDEVFYARENPDVVAKKIFLFNHFVSNGRFENRAPNPWIDLGHIKTMWGGFSNTDPLVNYFNSKTSMDFLPSQHLHRLFPEKLESFAVRNAIESLTLKGQKLNLSMEQAALISSIFYAPYYIRAARLTDNASRLDAMIHFLETGIFSGLSPSPLFQNDVYGTNWGSKIKFGQSPFLHWLTVGHNRGIIPTIRFNKEYYLATNQDLRRFGGNVFGHFLKHGMLEGRAPIVFCQTQRYRAWHKKMLLEYEQPYLRFLFSGFSDVTLAENKKTKLDDLDLTRPVSLVKPCMLSFVQRFDGLLAKIAQLRRQIPSENLDYLMELFDIDNANALLPGYIDNLLTSDLERQDDPALWFQPIFYAKQVQDSGMRPQVGTTGPLLHWLKYGAKKHIVPTINFDEKFYLKTYADIANAGIWGFEHYIKFGRNEGRRPSERVLLAQTVLPEHIFGPDDLGIYRKSFAKANILTENVLKSDTFQDMFKKLQEIDAGVGETIDYGNIVVSSVHQQIGWLHRNMRGRIKSDHYDTIICVPWVRMGGADLVAGLLAQAILRLGSDERLLIVQTDQSHFEWPEVLPRAADHIDLSDIFQFSKQDVAEQLLWALFIGLKPKRIINVNSRLCWTTFQRYGKRLSTQTSIYAYLFCWDRTERGARAGYPTEFYPETASFMTAIFTDTDYLNNELLRIYSPPEQARKRLFTLHSPSRSLPSQTTAASLGVQNSQYRKRPLILWAGRLDRQKRFDIVMKIARLMPEVDFHCWGKALLDAPPDLSKIPANIRMMAPFKSYEDLPLNESDGWLYTSAWDGMPTILIELAYRGVPIVASAVEGVCELVRDDTGWPVKAWDEPKAYVAALREMIGSGQLRVARAGALQKLASEVYSTEKFDAVLKDIFSKEIKK
jgi:glycosyltransferase involved in cell wall biosynthesis